MCTGDSSYKFNTGDDDAIARELGIDVNEAVQAIYKKLKDYGAERYSKLEYFWC